MKKQNKNDIGKEIVEMERGIKRGRVIHPSVLKLTKNNQICEKCKFDKACNDKIGKIIDCSDFKPKNNQKKIVDEWNKKLKTLKDLRDLIRQSKIDGVTKTYAEHEKLKAEAIKWVQTYFLADGLRASHLFMEFFNLTEEELKNEK